MVLDGGSNQVVCLLLGDDRLRHRRRANPRGFPCIRLVRTSRAAQAAECQSDVAIAEDRRASTPDLNISLDEQVSAGETRALHSAQRRRGRPRLGSCAATGDARRGPLPAGTLGRRVRRHGGTGSPLAMGGAAGLVLLIGPAGQLPESRVRVVCRMANDAWESSRLLDDPRFPKIAPQSRAASVARW